MKKISTILALAAVMLSGCGKFLDINPKGEVFDADMYSSGEGFEDALYGIYSELGNQEYLYRGYMLWIPEALSRNEISTDYLIGIMSEGDWYYQNNNVRNLLWTACYKAINHVNNIIVHAENLSEDEFRYSKLYKGEAYALRALLHFDLLGIYGAPYWADDSYKRETVPYVKNYSFDITPFSTWEGCYETIISDLKEAERLLAADSELLPAERTNSNTGFTDARITHLNLYAVQALLARVYWMKNDMEMASIYAMKVIDSGKFSFRPLKAFVQPDNGTLDLNETIFGIYSEDFQAPNMRKYVLGTTPSTTSFTLSSDWNLLYNDGSTSSGTDYRLSAWFDMGEGKLRKMVNDAWYVSGTSKYTGSSILGVSVLRIPEMYYILAEYYLDKDQSEACRYFNAVTMTRGLDPVSSLTANDLFRERRKEFYGEGLTWYDMKRAGMNISVSGGKVLDGSLPATYMMPIPDEEYEGRENLEL